MLRATLMNTGSSLALTGPGRPGAVAEAPGAWPEGRRRPVRWTFSFRYHGDFSHAHGIHICMALCHVRGIVVMMVHADNFIVQNMCRRLLHDRVRRDAWLWMRTVHACNEDRRMKPTKESCLFNGTQSSPNTCESKS